MPRGRATSRINTIPDEEWWSMMDRHEEQWAHEPLEKRTRHGQRTMHMLLTRCWVWN